MIILQAEHDYTLLFKAKAIAKTAKNPQSFTMIFNPGAGTTALDKRVAKNFYIDNPIPLNAFEPYGRQRFSSLFLADKARN